MPDVDPRLRELADFIRVRRDRLSPAALGVSFPMERRRAPGLRREELGRLAGVSADWIAWLEQGRDITLSPAAARRLAVALQLDGVETQHLLALAGKLEAATVRADAPSATLLAIVDAQGVKPAYVADGLGNLKAWNQAAQLVFDGFGARQSTEPNLLRYMFLFDGSHTIVDWERYARKMVAQFRLRHDRAGADGRFAQLSSELSQGSSAFEALWAEHEVRHRATGDKVVQHPRLGRLAFSYCNLQVEESPELTLTLHVPFEGCAATRAALERALADGGYERHSQDNFAPP